MDSSARAAPAATVATRARVAPNTSATSSAAPTVAPTEELDPLEPDVTTPGEVWSDAPLGAPATCPHEPLPKPADASCSRQQGLAALADALEVASSAETQSACESPWSAELAAAQRAVLPLQALKQRDRRLAQLESCAGLDAGLVRLTRVALWTECADALAITVPGGTLTAAMRGYATAARIERLSFAPAKDLASGPSEAAIARAMAWTEGQAAILRSAARAVNSLPAKTHGRAIAQLALGHAWNRLLHTRYDLPLLPPAERSAQRESLNVKLSRYVVESAEFAALAADAATIATEWPLLRAWQAGQAPGLVEAARAWVLPALPPLAPIQPREVQRRLAATLPSYVAAHLLSDAPLDTATLRALLERGLDPKLRRTLAAQISNPDQARLLAHARVVLAARALAPAQATAAVKLLHDNAHDDGEALSAIATALAALPAGLASWSAAQTRPDLAEALLAAASRSRSLVDAALLSYDAFRLENASVEPSARFAATEGLARERISAVGPALANCLPHGPALERGCACPALGKLY